MLLVPSIDSFANAPSFAPLELLPLPLACSSSSSTTTTRIDASSTDESVDSSAGSSAAGWAGVDGRELSGVVPDPLASSGDELPPVLGASRDVHENPTGSGKAWVCVVAGGTSGECGGESEPGLDDDSLDGMAERGEGTPPTDGRDASERGRRSSRGGGVVRRGGEDRFGTAVGAWIDGDSVRFAGVEAGAEETRPGKRPAGAAI